MQFGKLIIVFLDILEGAHGELKFLLGTTFVCHLVGGLEWGGWCCPFVRLGSCGESLSESAMEELGENWPQIRLLSLHHDNG